jgi:integrase
MRLTDQGIRGLPFTENGQRDYHDDAVPGLSVRVGKRTKTFMFLPTTGDRRRIALGRYDPPYFTLAMAREKAKDIAADLRLNPPEPRKLSPTYQEALETFYATHSAQRHRATTRKEVERQHNRHFIPKLGKKRLADITTDDVMGIIDKMLSTPSEANHAFRAVRTFLRWAVKRRLIDRSPVEGIDRPAPEVPRSRVLTPKELRAVWLACEQFSHFGPFVRCLILTGQRRGQFAQLRDHFVDTDKMVITWPADLMKAGKVHTIPYGPMMAKLLEDRSGVLFSTYRGAPFTVSGTPMDTFRKHCSVAHFTLHDLRRTWATISAEELDTPPHIIEAVLAHQSGTAVARTYNRAKYIEPMRKALVAFEEWLTTLLSNTETTNNGADVSGLHSKRTVAAE